MDLCAGCGCVGLAIAANVKSCRVVFVEKSARALDLCRENIARTAPARNTACIQADALEKPPVMQGGYNLIACNPPYIPAGDISRLDDSVRLYEPRAALDGGADGLDFFRAVTERWTALLLKGGHLAFECGAGQTGAVSKIMAARGFTNIRVTDDTAGIGRVVIGKL
jgi:release factor glutamine methyltransferase